MELSNSLEPEITMPVSMSYGSIHESNSKVKMVPAGTGVGAANSIGGNGGHSSEEIRPIEASAKKPARYRECLKNHAASIGGHAVDGCGEFMPSGAEGTLEALRCAACNCHRNFHRREFQGDPPYYCCSLRNDRKRTAPMALRPQAPLALPSGSDVVRPSPPMIMPLNSGPSESEEHELGISPTSLPHIPSLSHSSMPLPVPKKRFRTKFSAQQKEKMCDFARKLGWRIQKHDEGAVQQFCVDVGVKRHVLKVPVPRSAVPSRSRDCLKALNALNRLLIDQFFL